MGLLGRLIEFILSLFGVKKSAPALQLGGLDARERERIQREAIRGLDDIEGAENIRVLGTGPGAKIVKQVPGAALIEDAGQQVWISQANRSVSRQQWQDVWGPLANLPPAQRLDEYCYHSRKFDDLMAGQPLEAEKVLLGFGYRSVGEYYAVQTTIMKYHATPTGPNVGDCVFNSQEFANSAMRAAQRAVSDKQSAFAAANQALLAPVEGVSVELYAQIAARVAQQISQPDLMRLLAQHNLDFAIWDRANKEWTDRMSKDTTATIATIYGKAFMNAGQGQFGAAGQAAAATNWTGAAAGGAEPMPFEKACEIQGATSAWGKSGKDVNALLMSKFRMTAADWAQANTWWMTQLTANLSRFDEYNRKVAHYERQYTDQAAPADADIRF